MKEKKKFKHVVITRFNYDDREARDERMKIFKKHTLPNMQRQSCKDFTWVFFSKEELDIDFENKKFFTLTSYKQWKEELKKEYEYIIETRLDNDDMVSPNYIESIQLNFMEHTFVIEFQGYRYDKRNDTFYEDRFYNRNMTSPFLSLVSKLSEDRYVFEYDHNQMGSKFPLKLVFNRMWVQIIHESNKLMNKDSEKIISRRGRKCRPPLWFRYLEND